MVDTTWRSSCSLAWCSACGVEAWQVIPAEIPVSAIALNSGLAAADDFVGCNIAIRGAQEKQQAGQSGRVFAVAGSYPLSTTEGSLNHLLR